jgi:hypothetical protein
MSALVHCDGPDCEQVEPAQRRLCDAPWMRLDRGNTDFEPMLHFHTQSCLTAWALSKSTTLNFAVADPKVIADQVRLIVRHETRGL